MTDARFDELIHARPRLMICASLAEVAHVRFDLLAKALDMSAPTLSKHLSRLQEVGYVHTVPDTRDSRRQWLSLSPAGRAAYEGHFAALRELMP
ncbi:MarR family transcriptional regulator [Gordonia spumicola]|uniref:MarR family transcriptional regulator n=1 Tax=Gordonia spumicola TaxID=589161 RepID=A0A7I9V8T5_9ACTN|nr:transcriptional regulator [Gordonia spumicola]GEE01709.1 MarR family transcriptional regulator [Gordonia spumicola]